MHFRSLSLDSHRGPHESIDVMAGFVPLLRYSHLLYDATSCLPRWGRWICERTCNDSIFVRFVIIFNIGKVLGKKKSHCSIRSFIISYIYCEYPEKKKAICLRVHYWTEWFEISTNWLSQMDLYYRTLLFLLWYALLILHPFKK